MHVSVCMCAYTCLSAPRPEARGGRCVLCHTPLTLCEASFPESGPRVSSASLAESERSSPSASPRSELGFWAFGETTGLLHGCWALNRIRIASKHSSVLSHLTSPEIKENFIKLVFVLNIYVKLILVKQKYIIFISLTVDMKTYVHSLHLLKHK